MVTMDSSFKADSGEAFNFHTDATVVKKRAARFLAAPSKRRVFLVLDQFDVLWGWTTKDPHLVDAAGEHIYIQLHFSAVAFFYQNCSSAQVHHFNLADILQVAFNHKQRRSRVGIYLQSITSCKL